MEVPLQILAPLIVGAAALIEVCLFQLAQMHFQEVLNYFCVQWQQLARSICFA